MMAEKITWGFVGDPSQPQQLGHWRGVTCRNGLKEKMYSSYLPEKNIEKRLTDAQNVQYFAVSESV